MARRDGGQQAKIAIDDGRKVLVWSTRISDADQIEEIEALGWKIEHMSAFWNESLPSHADVVFLFRRD
jgi:hypothetical protein